jgi:two-component system NtrC family response regulator
MTINGKRILVIDDDDAMLRALRGVLGGEGAVVTAARGGAEALDHLANKCERFDLAITDLRMPIIGGRAILRAVAAAFPPVPVIILTAFGTAELEAQCVGEGAAAFLEKPLDTPRLLAVIEGVLDKP